MNKPENLKTKIYLDSGDPEDTKEVLDVLGFLDGQTTNPSLVAKHPTVAKCLEEGENCSEKMVLGYYKEIVQEISSLIPGKSVSVEVHAEKDTPAEKMIEQGREMNSWTPDAHIKLPITEEGLKAAEVLVKEGVRVNMTLCFSVEQAVAVYKATEGAEKGQVYPPTNADIGGRVYISPFIGRLEDIGENGMDLVSNILRMYKEIESNVDPHTKDFGMGVEVLAASIRNMDQFLESIRIGSDIVTLPAKILKEWAEKGTPLPDENFSYDTSGFKEIPFEKISLEKDWREYNIKHPLTDKGLQGFADDWNKLIN